MNVTMEGDLRVKDQSLNVVNAHCFQFANIEIIVKCIRLSDLSYNDLKIIIILFRVYILYIY